MRLYLSRCRIHQNQSGIQKPSAIFRNLKLQSHLLVPATLSPSRWEIPIAMI